MNAICLVIDRLHLGYVGAYGNSWIQTPSTDQLASTSLLFDRALVDSPQLAELYRSYWQGWHALLPQPPADRPTLAGMLRDAGVTTALLTDERLLAQHPAALDFEQLLQIDPPWQPQVAADIEQTHLAQCFVPMLDWLQSPAAPFLLWCHLGDLGTTWDAPLDMREAYWDEGDPEPMTTADVPERTLPKHFDPDDVLGTAQAYCGQVSLLDACIGAVVELLQTTPVGQETLLVLTSPRGFPLGEHGRIGPCDEPLYSELVHVPLLLRFPDELAAATRSPALVGPADLWATLLDWFQVGPPPAAPPAAMSLLPIARDEPYLPRDRFCIAGANGQRAIRTPAWHLRQTASTLR